MKIIELCVICLTLFSFCKQNPAEPKLPSLPEEVVRTWQESIDKNNFDLARKLSTGEALAYIDELTAYSGTDSLEWENNLMLNLKCQIFNDSAHCTYHFQDELGEPDPGQLALKKIKNRWFVSRVNFDEEFPGEMPDGDEMLFPGDSTDTELE